MRGKAHKDNGVLARAKDALARRLSDDTNDNMAGLVAACINKVETAQRRHDRLAKLSDAANEELLKANNALELITEELEGGDHPVTLDQAERIDDEPDILMTALSGDGYHVVIDHEKVNDDGQLIAALEQALRAIKSQ